MNKRFVVLGVLAFAVAAVALFPARTAYNWLKPPGLQLGGVSGTIWNGTAAEGLASGMYMRDISWQLKPLSVFTGKLAFATRFDPAAGFMDADVAVSPAGTVYLSDIAGTIPVNLLHASVPPLRGMQGNLNLQLTSVVLEDGFPTKVDGTVSLSGLSAAALSPSPIGNYEANFTSDERGVRGIVRDVGGVLAVTGELQLTPQRAYSLIGQVGLRPDTPATLSRQIEMLGSADAQGMREFRIEGQL
ncbi:MAG: type II secretion system protein N [Gammaproteobacteria bacterium]|nr:type II secretion system protein N [Gammaproteobacteria bacterium]